jgi:hypothetical protein
MSRRAKPKVAAAAEAAALQLAAEAGALELAAAAARPAEGADTLATLLAHELATGHRLMMRLAARAEVFLDHAAAEARSPDERRAGLEAARLAGAAGRLMERYRLGLLALQRLRAPGPGEAPTTHIRLTWAGMPPGEAGGAPGEGPGNGPGDDGPPAGGPGRGGGPGRAPGGGPKGASGGAPKSISDGISGDGSGAAPAAASAGAPRLGPAAPAAPARRRGRLRNGNPPGDYAAAPRCGAKTRAGGPCRQPAMPNGRCRLHGGKSTGPRSAEGLRRCRAARRRHGARSADLAALRRAAAAAGRRLRLLAAAAHGRSVGRSIGRPATGLPPGDSPLGMGSIVRFSRPVSAPAGRPAAPPRGGRGRARRLPPDVPLLVPVSGDYILDVPRSFR